MEQILYSLILLAVHLYKRLEKFIQTTFYPLCYAYMMHIFTTHGVQFNGGNPQDIQLKKENEREFFVRVANSALLGLGETYMEGLWDCERLDECLRIIFKSELHKKCWQVAEEHYNKGNDLFEAFLDKSLNYSCGYWRRASNLDQAQQHKMKLIGDKLKLKPGMKVLDIGCGWGSLAKFLAEKYGVAVVGCTISTEQAEFARTACSGLPVRIVLKDYRDLQEKFDRVVSVGMFEHVGTSNFRKFFQVASNCLEDDGILLLHTIGVSHPGIPLIEPWFHKYIFPNGILPYHTEILNKSDGLFVVEDWHNFGHDYARTLEAWRSKFVEAWPSNLEKRYDSKFYRMWYFYLSLSIGAFKSRKYQLWQIVMSKNGIEGGYESVR